MAETICYFNKEALVIKAPKRSPLVLRTVVLLFAMVCGVYICSMCLKQTSPRTKTKLLNIKVIHQPCQSTSIQQSEIPFLHYPNPVTFSSDQGVGGFDILNSHVDVSSNGEIFSVNHRRISISSIVSMMDGVYNLDWFTGASKNECSAAGGFKWTMNQGLMQHHNDIAEYFKKKRVSAVFLFRRNLLRRMISILANSYHRNAELLNGTHKSHVHSPAEAKILAKYKPTINATLLIPERKQIEQTTAKAIEYFKSTSQIVLYFEDLIAKRTKLKRSTRISEATI